MRHDLPFMRSFDVLRANKALKSLKLAENAYKLFTQKHVNVIGNLMWPISNGEYWTQLYWIPCILYSTAIFQPSGVANSITDRSNVRLIGLLRAGLYYSMICRPITITASKHLSIILLKRVKLVLINAISQFLNIKVYTCMTQSTVILFVHSIHVHMRILLLSH